jgi:hypothetical protein
VWRRCRTNSLEWRPMHRRDSNQARRIQWPSVSKCFGASGAFIRVSPVPIRHGFVRNENFCRLRKCTTEPNSKDIKQRERTPTWRLNIRTPQGYLQKLGNLVAIEDKETDLAQLDVLLEIRRMIEHIHWLSSPCLQDLVRTPWYQLRRTTSATMRIANPPSCN